MFVPLRQIWVLNPTSEEYILDDVSNPLSMLTWLFLRLIERSHLPFCPVMNIKAGTDPEDTYMKMLTQLSKVTGNIADAVMERAPTLRSLFESYQNEPDHHRRNALLSNVVVCIS